MIYILRDLVWKTLWTFHCSHVILILMNKSISVIHKTDPGNSGFVPGAPCERIAMVWPLTKEAVSLGKKYNVEQRLQRHIIRIIKKKG